MHFIFVFIYYLIYNASLLVISGGELKFKKGKKFSFYLCVLLNLTIPVILSLSFNHFQTGGGKLPLWAYVFHLICLYPIIKFCEGNPIVNWLSLFTICNVWYVVLNTCIAGILSPILPPARSLKTCTELSQWPHILALAICSSLAVCFSRIFFYIIKRTVNKRWAFFCISLLLLLPIIINITASVIMHTKEFSVSITTIIMNIICLPILLLICIIMHQITVYRRKKAISEIIENELLECSKEYDKIITMRKKCSHARHDLFNSISILEEYAASIKNNSEELTRMLDGAHRIVDKSRSLNSIEYCNNPVINILLAIKDKNAKERNIIPNFNISIPDDMNIQIYDLVCLLSNIIDNAIEATEKIDSEVKEITMTIHAQSGYLCIECLNPFKEDLNPIKRKYLTTKEDTSNHGLGTQIIADIVNTYNGYSKASVLKDNRYSLMVALKL